MATLSVDGKTMNSISKLYSQYVNSEESEFEFKAGEFIDGKFSPGVSFQQWTDVFSSLKIVTRYVRERSTVYMYDDGYREIRSDKGVLRQRKYALAHPVPLDGIGRFSLSREEVVDRFPEKTRQTGKRERDRYIFAFDGYTVELTKIVNQNKYEIEVEYDKGLEVRTLFSPIKTIVSSADGKEEVGQSVVDSFQTLFGRKGVHFNNALNMKRKYFGELGDFIITPKWDGTRMMLYVSAEGPVLLNRTTRLRAPFSVTSDLVETVFDGEFFENTGKYIAFDILFRNGKDMKERPRIERTLVLEQTHMRYNLPFEMAEVGYGGSLHTCFVNYVTKYPDHVLDGVVFSPRSSTYYNDRTLKYKPIDLLTIDFLITVDRGELRYPRYSIFVEGERGPEPFNHVPYIQKVDEEGKKIIGNGGKIVECKWEGDTFVPHRVRKDKTKANFRSIAEDIWEDINSPITEDEMGSVLRDISQRFKHLSPFEGLTLTSMGPEYVASSPGTGDTFERAVGYATIPNFQLKRESDRVRFLESVSGFIDRVSDSVKKVIEVYDFYGGDILYRTRTTYGEKIMLAYVVGPRYYTISRFETREGVCLVPVKIFQSE